MTPKEKAEELYKQMLGDDGSTHPKVFGGVKRCTLIAIDEIINQVYKIQETQDVILYNTLNWWKEVKQEIERL